MRARIRCGEREGKRETRARVCADAFQLANERKGDRGGVFDGLLLVTLTSGLHDNDAAAAADIVVHMPTHFTRLLR